MINCIFGGGLGNQMFQYAFLFSQLRNSNRKDKRINAIMHRNPNEDLRNFSLHYFQHSLRFNVLDENDIGIRYKMYICRRKSILKLCKILGRNDSFIVRYMKKYGIVYSPSIYGYYEDLSVSDNCYIEGAFQNWRYFEQYSDELREEFSVACKVPLKEEAMLQLINSCNAVCVHIRRGDYTNSHYSKILSVCNEKYYKDGIALIQKKVENPVFFVFTNSHADHIWIKEHYQLEGEVHYVDLDNPDYEELRLMSSCKHFIIANSTFSWWAQYLSSNKEKIVVAPSVWYRGSNAADGIYMPSWNLITVK